MLKKAHIIIGANYGDEGKGQITSALCSSLKKMNFSVLNILTNGGAQRGHTVIDKYDTLSNNNIIYHVYHHFGSGTMYDVDNYYCRDFIINPMMFVLEYDELKSLGFDFRKINIFCNIGCRWTTPYDMLVNQVLEDSRGEYRHGSTGMGIWETVNRNNTRPRISIFEFVKLSGKEQVEYLRDDVMSYFSGRLISHSAHLSDNQRRIFEDQNLMDHFIDDCIFFTRVVKPIEDESFMLNYNHLVFENGQGLLLNSDEKNVHTTPSNTGCIDSMHILNDLKLPDTFHVDAHYITRPYLTRHGAGDIIYGEECTVDDMSSIGILLNHERTNVENKYQGQFRYGKLSIDWLNERVLHDFNLCKFCYPNSRFIVDVTHTSESCNVDYMGINNYKVAL